MRRILVHRFPFGILYRVANEGNRAFLKNDKKNTVAEKETAKESTVGYTFARGGQLVVVIFRKPGDSGAQCYFIEEKEVADKMLPVMFAEMPTLIGSSVVQCTLEEILQKAKKCGASVCFIGPSLLSRL